jgi:hypothetical protein
MPKIQRNYSTTLPNNSENLKLSCIFKKVTNKLYAQIQYIESWKYNITLICKVLWSYKVPIYVE